MFYSKRTQIGTVWYNMILYGKVRKYLYYKSGQLVKAFVGQKLDNVDRAFCPPTPPSPLFSPIFQGGSCTRHCSCARYKFPKGLVDEGAMSMPWFLVHINHDDGDRWLARRWSSPHCRQMPLHLPRIKVRNVTVWINTGGTPARTFHKETFSFSCSFFPQVFVRA